MGGAVFSPTFRQVDRMKVVEFTRDMSPHRIGETRVVPDDMATRLFAAGDVLAPRPFPPSDVVPSVPVAIETATPARKRYMTRNRRA